MTADILWVLSKLLLTWVFGWAVGYKILAFKKFTDMIR